MSYTIDQICQLWILLVGIFTAYFVTSPKDNYRRISYLISILGQPVWIYVTYKHDQFGIFTLSIYFTICQLRGIYYYWVLPFISKRSIWR
jgi:hypothetical protein